MIVKRLGAAVPVLCLALMLASCADKKIITHILQYYTVLALL